MNSNQYIYILDTLGVVARSIGEQHFAPLAITSLDLGIRLLKNTDDPDLRKSLYGLFAAISSVMKKEMAAALPEVVEYMLASIRSSDGIVVNIAQLTDTPEQLQRKWHDVTLQMHLKDDDEAGVLTVYDDLSESESEEEDIEHSDDEDDDIEGYSVENAYIEEKEESVLALKEIAEYTE